MSTVTRLDESVLAAPGPPARDGPGSSRHEGPTVFVVEVRLPRKKVERLRAALSVIGAEVLRLEEGQLSQEGMSTAQTPFTTPFGGAKRGELMTPHPHPGVPLTARSPLAASAVSRCPTVVSQISVAATPTCAVTSSTSRSPEQTPDVMASGVGEGPLAGVPDLLARRRESSTGSQGAPSRNELDDVQSTARWVDGCAPMTQLYRAILSGAAHQARTLGVDAGWIPEPEATPPPSPPPPAQATPLHRYRGKDTPAQQAKRRLHAERARSPQRQQQQRGKPPPLTPEDPAAAEEATGARTPLALMARHFAFSKGEGLKVLASLAKDTDLSHKGVVRQSALHRAARLGNAAKCEKLLELGWDRNELDYRGRTPMELVAQCISHIDDAAAQGIPPHVRGEYEATLRVFERRAEMARARDAARAEDQRPSFA